MQNGGFYSDSTLKNLEDEPSGRGTAIVAFSPSSSSSSARERSSRDSSEAGIGSDSEERTLSLSAKPYSHVAGFAVTPM